jgi:hypothetical protein
MTGGRMILLPNIYYCFRQASYIIKLYHENLTLLQQLALPPPSKRKERVWDQIEVPPWHDGAAVGDPSKIVEGKRQRKTVNYSDK